MSKVKIQKDQVRNMMELSLIFLPIFWKPEQFQEPLLCSSFSMSRYQVQGKECEFKFVIINITKNLKKSKNYYSDQNIKTRFSALLFKL